MPTNVASSFTKKYLEKNPWKEVIFSKKSIRDLMPQLAAKMEAFDYCLGRNRENRFSTRKKSLLANIVHRGESWVH